jgi:dTDP-4-dehydrorhamnose reductase/UDP-glucose 4-epimerase
MDDTFPDARPILVVGRGSFLARGFAGVAGRPACRFVSHSELGDPGVFEGVGRIVNFALDPRWRAEDCPPEADLDLHLGRVAADRGLGYVMLSTRKVYRADRQWDADEDAPLGPADAYGRNKLASERRLGEILGDRLLVLRVGNVIGFEAEPGRRTFMGTVLASLARQGRVTLDVDPGVRRDFLSDAGFCRLLAAVVMHSLTGTYNLGSGDGTALGDLVGWVIEGYGRGQVEVTDHRMHDAFRLDVSRLRRALGRDWPQLGPLDDFCRDLGMRLRTVPAPG